jgi:hypothetical protein
MNAVTVDEMAAIVQPGNKYGRDIIAEFWGENETMNALQIIDIADPRICFSDKVYAACAIEPAINITELCQFIDSLIPSNSYIQGALAIARADVPCDHIGCLELHFDSLRAPSDPPLDLSPQYVQIRAFVADMIAEAEGQ